MFFCLAGWKVRPFISFSFSFFFFFFFPFLPFSFSSFFLFFIFLLSLKKGEEKGRGGHFFLFFENKKKMKILLSMYLPFSPPSPFPSFFLLSSPCLFLMRKKLLVLLFGVLPSTNSPRNMNIKGSSNTKLRNFNTMVHKTKQINGDSFFFLGKKLRG